MIDVVRTLVVRCYPSKDQPQPARSSFCSFYTCIYCTSPSDRSANTRGVDRGDYERLGTRRSRSGSRECDYRDRDRRGDPWPRALQSARRSSVWRYNRIDLNVDVRIAWVSLSRVHTMADKPGHNQIYLRHDWASKGGERELGQAIIWNFILRDVTWPQAYGPLLYRTSALSFVGRHSGCTTSPWSRMHCK